MRKLYLAGPMRGIPHFNFPAFMRAAERLRDDGFEVFNPAQSDIDALGVDPSVGNLDGDEALAAALHGLNARDCFFRDTEFICKHADGIALLPGWEKSKGARAEKALADALGLVVLYLDEEGYIVGTERNGAFERAEVA